MNLNKIDPIVVVIILILGISLTYIYSVIMTIAILLSLLGVWYFITGMFTEGKNQEAFMKTPMHRVIVGGFLLIIGVPLLILYLIGDVRIALIASIAIITLTILAGYYTERK
jgi:protein-S-isoprenylcysteine O-methyltransferase Ste14